MDVLAVTVAAIVVVTIDFDKSHQQYKQPSLLMSSVLKSPPTYAETVYLIVNQSAWKTSEDYLHMIVLPPKVVKRVGRLKKKRIPSVGEAPKLHKCGRCKEIGHNRLTCTNTISYTEKSSIQI
ncbi:hypothetical protein IC582_016711 [Cucumis melo]